MRYQPVNRYRDPCRVRLDTVLTVCEILVCLALLALFVVLFAKALTLNNKVAPETGIAPIPTRTISALPPFARI